MDAAQSVPIPAASGELAGENGPGQYAGIAAHANGGACVLRIFDSKTGAVGTLIDVIELTASGVGSFASYTLNPPVFFTSGIWVQLVSGIMPEGSVRLG